VTRGARALGLLVATYGTVVGGLCWIKWRYFLYRDFDLAIFAQAMERLLRGSLHGSIRGMAWPGDHASLVLFLVAPIYAIARHPFTLLAIQTAALALGAVAVYRIARRRLSRGDVAWALAAAYLLQPALCYLNLFEFHPEALATTALLFTLERLEHDRGGQVLLCAGLALACREDVALAVLALALVVGWTRRPRGWRLGGALAGLAVASLIMTLALLRPLFNAGQAEYGGMYRAWGETPLDVVRGVLLHPASALAALVSTTGDPFDTALKQATYLHLLLPLLFLPVLSPLVLAPALPILAEHMLSARTPQHAIAHQYAALILPFVAVAAVAGLDRLSRWGTRRSDPRRATVPLQVAAGLMVLAALGSQLAFGPLASPAGLRALSPNESVLPRPDDRALRSHRERLLARMPPAGPVVAGFEFLSRLSRRNDVHSLHHVLTGVYTYSTRPYPAPDGATALLADFGDLQTLAYLDVAGCERLRAFCDRNRLEPAEAVGDLLLLLRRPAGAPALIGAAARAASASANTTYDGEVTYLGCDPARASVGAGGLVPVTTYWRRYGAGERIFALQLGLFDARGSFWYQHHHDLGTGLRPPGTWPAGVPVVETYPMVVPPGLPPGRYTIAARVLSRRAWRDQALAVPDDPAQRGPGSSLDLGTIDVR
jgi:uncharacterized membrane protein